MRRVRGADLPLGLLAVAVNVLLVAGVVMVTSGASEDRSVPPPTSSTSPLSSTPEPLEEAQPSAYASTSASSGALPRLVAEPRPVTLAVLGDGTGDESGEWVSALGTLVGQDHRALVHNLDQMDPTRYADDVTFGAQGMPFTIWNASRRGAAADYAAARLSFMVPARPDAVLLSYGRADEAADVGRRLSSTLRALRARWPAVPVAVVLQAPERGDAGADTRRASRAWAQASGVPTIDVAEQLSRLGDTDQFVSVVDPSSVNRSGGEEWARVVYRALGGAAGEPAATGGAPSQTASPSDPSRAPTPIRPRPRPGFTPPLVDPSVPTPTGTTPAPTTVAPTATPTPTATATASEDPTAPPTAPPPTSIVLPPLPTADGQ